ncbi:MULTISPECIES: MarR family winged helix-turn-helix transcriptional regulator [Falsihalocynthiibacter]|uniref:MarR family winged helix-turn-helix transcriptional regulator n=1 Tax=Falsihalocynthiibacter TaxID=2854182 RepID=UPI0030028EEF
MVKSDVAAAVLIEKIVRATYPSREPGAIQPLQWSILRFLARVPSEQRTAHMVAKFLGITAAPTSRAVQTLVKRGFIEQVKSEHDARSFLLVLQPAALQALKDDPLMRLAECVSKLPEDEKGVFKKSLECIVVNVG